MDYPVWWREGLCNGKSKSIQEWRGRLGPSGVSPKSHSKSKDYSVNSEQGGDMVRAILVESVLVVTEKGRG